MSYSGKLENLLILSLESTAGERSSSKELSAGVDEAADRWEIIVKFFAESEDDFSERIRGKFPETEITLLLCNYCIIETARENINLIAQEPDVAYIEKPKILNYDLINAKRASCFNLENVNLGFNLPYTLTGKGVIVAVIDTGIDISDAAFRNEDGSTRILRFFDQQSGKILNSDEINDELLKNDNPKVFDVDESLFSDYSGHGINVCRIACGRDGAAPEASIIFVKLKRSFGTSNTTDMMKAVDYCIRTAVELNMPIALNISYGSNYGPHIGDDIQTSYINDVCGVWKSCICVAAGNEARDAVHAQAKISRKETYTVQLAVREYEQDVSFAIWLSPLDDISVTLVSPDGEELALTKSADTGGDAGKTNTRRTLIKGTLVTSFAGAPKPYSEVREVYVSLCAAAFLDAAAGKVSDSYVTEGIWKIILTGNYVKNGEVNMWLSSASVINEKTGFTRPSPELTFTVPSTAQRVLTVGSYNPSTMTVSAFSGRGYVTDFYNGVKPDLVAPGENVQTAAGQTVSGTSFAAPFAAGAAALLMEWGIVKGNDPDMYGDKLKSVLKKGAIPLSGQSEPSSASGWGRLCVRNALILASKF